MQRLKLITIFILLLVLMIPVKAQDDDTIVDVVTAAAEADEAEFTVLLELVTELNLAATLADTDAEFTVFAPTDAAFEALLEEFELTMEDLLETPDLVKDILLYHIAEGTFSASDLAELETVATVQGSEIVIALDDDENIVLDDVAAVVEADIEAANGVIHVIDNVLLPPEEGAVVGEAVGGAAVGGAAGGAQTEACLVSTTEVDTVRVRVGPGENRTSVSFLPADQEFEPLGQTEDDAGNIWFQLDKEEAAPGRSINEAWVAADELDTTGDCSAIGEAAAPPIIPITNLPPPSNTGGGDTGGGDTGGGGQAATDTSTLPASGTYTMTLAGTSHVSCEGTNSVPFPTTDLFDTTSLRVSLRSSAQSITLDGDVIPFAGPGYYTGQFSIDAGVVVTIQIFTGNSSSFSGRINYSMTLSGRGCSVGTDFSARR
jgi:uncharacterized surface protein with fasciclin (FAS1) repeats